MLATFYVEFQRVLQLVSLLCRSAEFKELEIVVVRHELTVLRRQVRRPELQPADRLFLAAASRLLPRVRWSSFMVRPTTAELAPNDGGGPLDVSGDVSGARRSAVRSEP